MSLYDRFKHRFQAVEPEPTGPDPGDPQRLADLADCRTWVRTKHFAMYRQWLVSEIERTEPDPVGGTDAAAANAFLRSGLNRALRGLDTMARLAQEEE